jgi:hypothetical protein
MDFLPQSWNVLLQNDMENKHTRLRTVQVMRYIMPLREGGSMPAVTEADDGFSYVLKFRGAGQGPKALIAELLGGEIARLLGFNVPELVYAVLDEAFGRTEPDEEIQDLLKASTGLNLGLHYLAGAITFDPLVTAPDSELASKVVWLDSLLTNVDRTVRNTNMLQWHKELWLIDHGAAFFFHHADGSWAEQALRPFGQIRNHVLLPQASCVREADKELRPLLTRERIDAIVSLIPEEWLGEDARFSSFEEHRQAYAGYLEKRISHSEIFVKEIEHARNISV